MVFGSLILTSCLWMHLILHKIIWHVDNVFLSLSVFWWQIGFDWVFANELDFKDGMYIVSSSLVFVCKMCVFPLFFVHMVLLSSLVFVCPMFVSLFNFVAIVLFFFRYSSFCVWCVFSRYFLCIRCCFRHLSLGV